MAAVESATPGATTQDLYSQYSRQIYSYCLHKLRSREDAEDAVQTTFMNAFRSLQRGATTQFEQAWLFKIAQNVCFARQTSSSKRLRLEAPNDFDALQETVPARDGEQPLELMGLEEALEQMPENQRRVILMREWQGLSYREISEQLDLSQAAVEMLIFRARRTLAGALEEPGEVRERKVRAGRKVGALGSLLGALKTLFGGGAAIKAASIAAAAIAVVGESANHTIVRHSAAVKARRVAVEAVAGKASAPVASRAQFRARAASAVAGSPTAPSRVAERRHTVRPHAAAKAGSAVAASRPRRSAHPRGVEPVVAAAAAPAVVVQTPAPAPPAAVTTPAEPVAAPAAVQPTAVPVAPSTHEDPPKNDDRHTTSISPPAQPASEDKSERGNGKGQLEPQPAPVVAAPVVTADVVTAPVVTTTAPQAAPPAAPPASDDHGNGDGDGDGHGNGNARGHDK